MTLLSVNRKNGGYFLCPVMIWSADANKHGVRPVLFIVGDSESYNTNYIICVTRIQQKKIHELLMLYCEARHVLLVTVHCYCQLHYMREKLDQTSLNFLLS